MTEERVKRKISAIFSADVEGYSRLMGDDEVATVRTLENYRNVMVDLIEQHRGRVVDSPGDNLLAEFGSVVDAVQCAVEIQQVLKAKNAELPENRRMQFRIGVNLGDVIEEGERIYGDGVNIAARIEGLAEGGGICVSGSAYEQIENKLALGYEYLGEHAVKNITKPVRVYRVPMELGERKEKRAGMQQWKKVAVAAAAVIIVGAGVFAIWNFYFRPPPIEPASVEKMAFSLPDKPSIAVLPFDNMSGDPQQDYFSDGITEQIIASLSKVPYLFVIARNSTFTYKGKPVKVNQVAEELGVRYVLEGSVQRSNDQVRITAQLIDAIAGHHIWAEKYDRQIEDIFALQDDIAMKIMAALQVKLSAADMGRLSSIKTTNIKAYEKFLKGWEHIWRRTEGDVLEARKLAQEATALDPKYGAPYLLMGLTHLNDVWFYRTKSPAKSLQIAEQNIQKAIDLSGQDASTHQMLGHLYILRKEYDKAIAECQKAVDFDPNSAQANFYFGMALRFAGRFDEAIPILQKAIRLNPVTPINYLNNLAYAYLFSEQYEKAIPLWNRTLERNPDYLFAYLGLTCAYQLSGNEVKAREAAAEVIRIKPNLTVTKLEKGAATKSVKRKRMMDAFRKAGIPDKPPLPLPDKPSIAVLPFTNMSEDPKQEYFSDGITEEIITALSKTPKLFVIARNSTFTYKGKPVKVQQVGRELGVKYVLEGSVRKAGDKVRITAQLVDAKTGNHIWAERYDRDLKDIFALQDEITVKVITALQVELTEGEQARIYGRGTNNLEAYFKVLEGREQSSRFNKDGNALGRQLFEQAIALDPNYAMAYWRLSATHLMDLILGSTKSPKGSLKQAEELVQKALALDGALAEAHALLGRVYLAKRQYEQAIAEGERAIAIDPNSPIAQYALAFSLTRVGKYEEAIALYKKAMRSDPIPSPSLLTMLGNAYIVAGRYEDGISTLKKVLRRSPDNLVAHVGLAIGYSSSGRDEEARNEAIEILRIDPKFSLEHFGKRLMYKDQADTDRVVGALRKAGLK